MKRLLFSAAACAGLMLAGITNASASYCSLDPTLGIGAPIHTSTTVSTSLLGTSTDLYVYNDSKTTTFGGGIGLP
jgi:hypothetical protein